MRVRVVIGTLWLVLPAFATTGAGADDGPHTQVTTVDETTQRRPGARFEVRVADPRELPGPAADRPVPDTIGEIAESACDDDDGELNGHTMYHDLPFELFMMLVETTPPDGCDLV